MAFSVLSYGCLQSNECTLINECTFFKEVLLPVYMASKTTYPGRFTYMSEFQFEGIVSCLNGEGVRSFFLWPSDILSSWSGHKGYSSSALTKAHCQEWKARQFLLCAYHVYHSDWWCLSEGDSNSRPDFASIFPPDRECRAFAWPIEVDAFPTYSHNIIPESVDVHVYNKGIFSRLLNLYLCQFYALDNDWNVVGLLL